MAITPRTIFTNPGTAAVAAASLFAMTAAGMAMFMSCPSQSTYEAPCDYAVDVYEVSDSPCDLMSQDLPVERANWSEYNWLIDHLIATDFIHSPREIWWDVRPVASLGTVEIRVMDTPISMQHLLGMVALIQCIVAGISDDIDRGMYLVDCHPMIARQNKWHAARYGLNATLADPDTMLAVGVKQQARRLLDLCTGYAQKLDCVQELGFVERILEQGTGASIQQRVSDRSDGDMNQVVSAILDETGRPWDSPND